MQIGVPREQLAGETRVAASPSSVEQLIKLGFEVCIESKAGALASFDDAAYTAAGATIGSREEIWACPLILKVNAPSDDEIALLKEGATLVSFIWPAQNPALMENSQVKHQRTGDGCGASYFSCASIGCTLVDGEHCRLPCSGRSRS